MFVNKANPTSKKNPDLAAETNNKNLEKNPAKGGKPIKEKRATDK